MRLEPEEFLKRLKPRGADPQLRERIRERLEHALAPPPTPPFQGVENNERKRGWTNWPWRMVGMLAAGFVAAMLLNVWAVYSDDARFVRISGPPLISREIREIVRAVQKVAGEEVARDVERRLVAAERSKITMDSIRRQMGQHLMELQYWTKETTHEIQEYQLEKNSKDRGDLGGSIGHRLAAGQRHLDLVDRRAT